MYTFDAEYAFGKIQDHWLAFANTTQLNTWVVGISGGIDSTCVAALACKIFGTEHVVGVSLPCNGQKDIADVNHVFDVLKIKRIDIDIGEAFNSIINGVENNAIEVKVDTKTNLPARLRMSTLYAVAQSLEHATVLNTCNISETINGYDTLWGDSCGSYAPIQKLTKTEVRQLAKWLGIPTVLVEKTSIDGLQTLTDEEKLGITYEKIDKIIRLNEGTDEEKTLLYSRYNKNKFKIDMIHIEHHEFDYPNYIIGQCK